MEQELENHINETVEKYHHKHNQSLMDLLRDIQKDVKDIKNVNVNQENRINAVEEFAIKAEALRKFYDTAVNVNDGINWFSDFSWKIIRIIGFFVVLGVMFAVFFWGKVKSLI